MCYHRVVLFNLFSYITCVTSIQKRTQWYTLIKWLNNPIITIHDEKKKSNCAEYSLDIREINEFNENQQIS